MEVQQRFPGLARRFERVGVPGPISDSCVFIISKRDELLKASLCILLRDSFKSHWDVASKECRTEYPKLAAELHASWCCWSIMRQLGFDYTWEQVKGTGNHTERLDFLEDLLECIEEFVEPPGADEQQQQVRLMAATSERFAALCNSNVQLFDSEFAQLIQEKQQAHAASNAYIHSIEATAQQMRENISKLKQQVHPVPGERWQAVFEKLQASHTDFLDVAKALDQTYHIELVSWSAAAAQQPDDLGMGKAAADIMTQQGKLKLVQRELALIRDSYAAIARSAAPLQDLDQEWLRELAREAAGKVSELKKEIAALGGSLRGSGGRSAAALAAPAASGGTAGAGSWCGTSSSTSASH